MILKNVILYNNQGRSEETKDQEERGAIYLSHLIYLFKSSCKILLNLFKPLKLENFDVQNWLFFLNSYFITDSTIVHLTIAIVLLFLMTMI